MKVGVKAELAVATWWARTAGAVAATLNSHLKGKKKMMCLPITFL